LLNRADVVTAYVRLSDRFGDNGIISVFYGHQENNSLVIDQWLMSCRVFKRGVEYLLARHVIDLARSLGVESVRGTYVPTDKNRIVKELYSDLGFKQDTTQQDGATTWILKPDDFKAVTVYIAETEDSQK
jgi:FkbH-like protein